MAMQADEPLMIQYKRLSRYLAKRVCVHIGGIYVFVLLVLANTQT
jgi:hypothetical protein